MVCCCRPIRAHVWKDEQKITSDSLMEPAAATSVTALFPKVSKRTLPKSRLGRARNQSGNLVFVPLE